LARDLVLAIDLGTSGPKAAVVARSGVALASASEPVDTIFLPDGGVEQDPRQWWSTIVTACRRALAASGRPAGDVLAVCVTSQYMSTVAVDAAGEPLMNVLMWLDHRGRPYNRALLDDHSYVRWIELHGLIPLPSGNDGLGHVGFVKHERPEIYAKADAFLEPMDYVNLKLTGVVAATQSTAFPFMLIDNNQLGRLDYCTELVERSGIDVDKMPPLVPFDTILGPLTPSAAEDLGLPEDTQVVMGASDSITAALGTGAVDAQHASLIVGTTSVMVSHVNRKDTDLERGVLSVPSPLGSYFVMAENGIGGRALEHWLRNVVYAADDFGTGAEPHDMYERAMRVAATVPAGSDGVLYLPWLVGSLAPAPSDHVRGGFVGLTLTHTRAHMTRALLEGVALNFRWLKPYVERFVGNTFDSFRFGGGGAQSDEWAQVMADVLGVPVQQLADARSTNARGAALLAFERLGLLTFDDVPDLLHIRRTYEPDQANHARYHAHADAFAAFHAASEQALRLLRG